MSNKHSWKAGDLFWHDHALYMVTEVSGYSIHNCLRLNDGDRGIIVAANNWYLDPEAKFICNIQEVFAELERTKFGLENI